MSERALLVKFRMAPVERVEPVPWCSRHRCSVLPPAEKCGYAVGVVKPLRECAITGVVWKVVDDE